MRGNDQKYAPDPRARSPGLSQYPSMLNEFPSSGSTYNMHERMSYIPPDYGRMTSGGGMAYPTTTSFNSNLYERDFKMPTTFAAPAPQQYPAADFRSNFDPNSVFVPQSKYLQEEMKKNTFGKDFNYAPPSTSKPMSMGSGYQGMSIPQPQAYDMKPEMPK